MRSLKRNAVIITVVLFVCVAAYLNWSYSKDTADTTEVGVTEPTPGQDIFAQNPNANDSELGQPAANQDGGDLFYKPASPMAAYFAEARLTRQQARDTAVETLAAINDNSGASQTMIDETLAKISAIATNAQSEAELETLIRAKGFTDCVVFISDDGVKVTVPAPQSGLTSVEVAKITDIVTSETSFGVAALKIIEVKAM
jgi:stage III sporulation protein AH